MATYIPGLVISVIDEQLICSDGVYGRTMDIPCPDGGLALLDGDFWCSPVVDNGLWLGVKFSQGGASQTVGPTVQSFQVVRVSDRLSGNAYYVRGNSTQFINSCAVCCGNAPISLPTDLPHIAPCQTLCDQLSAGNYGGVWAIPDLPAGFGYYPTIYFNNTKTTQSPIAGFSTITALLAWLNGNYGNIGTWSVSADNRTLFVIQNPGPGTDTVCLMIVAVNASGGSPF